MGIERLLIIAALVASAASADGQRVASGGDRPQEADTLQDVVVVAYGTARKESLTGSVATVGAKKISSRPVTSVTAALEGNAPGVMVDNSTVQPGQSPDIRIRGFSSINGSNAPLYVVDGTVYEGSLANLNPQDIESMSVLKDAASCALYGNRGANGVIIITTKRAKTKGKAEVTLQVRRGWNERALPFYDRMNADEWMETSMRAYANGLATSGAVDNPLEYASANFINDIALLNIYDRPDAELFDSDGRLTGSILPGYRTGRDWWDVVSRSGSREEYNVSVTGATDRLDAYASAGYLKTKGYMLQTDFERYNGRASINASPTDYFRTGLNVSAVESRSNRSPVNKDALNYTNNPFNSTIFKAPIYPYYLHDADGAVVYGEDGSPVWNTEAYNNGDNIAWQMREDSRIISTTQADGSVFGTAVIPYGFEATVKGSMYRSKSTDTRYNNRYVGSQKDVGSLSSYFYETKTHTFQQQLSWSHEYGMHHVDALLEHENYSLAYNQEYASKSGQQLPGVIAMDNFSDMKSISQYSYKRTTESYLGRARYNYAQKYFGELSLRRDGTSRFDKNNRWGTFWSAGASWIISRENFMTGLTWMDHLKLRASYGSVGNDASAPTYAYQALYDFGQPLAGTTAILEPYQLAPENLKWESTKTLDIALEGTLFDSRLDFTIGYYDKRNTDLLFWVAAPLSSGTLGNLGGAPKVLRNIGDMRNEGWEIGLGVDIIRSNDWNWHFNADVSFLKNKILKLPGGQDIVSEALFKGHSLYEQYCVDFAGVDLTTGQSLYAMNPSSPDFQTYDEDNRLVFDEAYYNSQLAAAAKNGALVEIDGEYYTTLPAYAGRKIQGTSLPTAYGSFGSDISWKGLSLSMLFTYGIGGKSRDSNYGSLMSITASASAIHKDNLKAWTEMPEGMAPHTQGEVEIDGVSYPVWIASASDVDPDGIPQVNTTNSGYNNNGSRWLTRNDYLSLKNISLTYDFPVKWVSAARLRGASLGFAVDNVFLATRRKGFNPQFDFDGSQGAYFVPTRTYSFSLTVRL